MSLQKPSEGGSEYLVSHVGGPLISLSLLPAMRLKLNALSGSAPHVRTATLTAVPRGFAERLLGFSGKKVLCQTQSGPADAADPSPPSVASV